MREILRGDPELDRKLASCNDPSLVREIVKSHYVEMGLIRREPGNEFDMRLISQPSAEQRPPVAPLAAVPVIENHIRVIYPRGNDRIEIYGSSEAELDEKERQIWNLYGQ